MWSAERRAQHEADKQARLKRDAEREQRLGSYYERIHNHPIESLGPAQKKAALRELRQQSAKPVSPSREVKQVSVSAVAASKHGKGNCGKRASPSAKRCLVMNDHFSQQRAVGSKKPGRGADAITEAAATSSKLAGGTGGAVGSVQTPAAAAAAAGSSLGGTSSSLPNSAAAAGGAAVSTSNNVGSNIESAAAASARSAPATVDAAPAILVLGVNPAAPSALVSRMESTSESESDAESVVLSSQVLMLARDGHPSNLDEMRGILQSKGMTWLNSCRDEMQWGCVHHAASADEGLPMLKWLRSHHAAMNQTSSGEKKFPRDKPIPAGSTCLHVAVACRQLETVQFLLSIGEESFVQFPNTEGKTARDMIATHVPSGDRKAFSQEFKLHLARTQKPAAAAAAAATAAAVGSEQAACGADAITEAAATSSKLAGGTGGAVGSVQTPAAAAAAAGSSLGGTSSSLPNSAAAAGGAAVSTSNNVGSNIESAAAASARSAPATVDAAPAILVLGMAFVNPAFIESSAAPNNAAALRNRNILLQLQTRAPGTTIITMCDKTPASDCVPQPHICLPLHAKGAFALQQLLSQRRLVLSAVYADYLGSSASQMAGQYGTFFLQMMLPPLLTAGVIRNDTELFLPNLTSLREVAAVQHTRAVAARTPFEWTPITTEEYPLCAAIQEMDDHHIGAQLHCTQLGLLDSARPFLRFKLVSPRSTDQTQDATQAQQVIPPADAADEREQEPANSPNVAAALASPPALPVPAAGNEKNLTPTQGKEPLTAGNPLKQVEDKTTEVSAFAFDPDAIRI